MGKRGSAGIKDLPIVFLDSSVFFSAVNSPSGGSAKLFTLQNEGKVLLFTTYLVTTETERNIRGKLPEYALSRYLFLAEQIEMHDTHSDEDKISEIVRKDIIVRKDAGILIDAKNLSVDYLTTLDRKHFFTKEVATYLNETKVVTPGALIRILENLD